MKINNTFLNFKGQVVINKKETARNILISKPYINNIITAFNFVNQDLKYNTNGDRDFSLSYTASVNKELTGEFKVKDLDSNKIYSKTFKLPLKPDKKTISEESTIINTALGVLFEVLGDKSYKPETSSNPELQRIIDRLI